MLSLICGGKSIEVLEEEDDANADELSVYNEDSIVDDLVRTFSDLWIGSKLLTLDVHIQQH